jgi:hypothetical protein
MPDKYGSETDAEKAREQQRRDEAVRRKMQERERERLRSIEKKYGGR